MQNVDLVVEMLASAGVRWAFGVPSGPVLPLIDALRRHPGIEYVLTASETSAGFMAEAVGRLTGVPGVCVSTVGPGATNMATGVGGAWLDRSPVIAITCTYATRVLGRRTQMLIDHQALFAPITRASFRLERGSVARTLADAMSIATAEPPGPVHLDFPEDVGTAEATESFDKLRMNAFDELWMNAPLASARPSEPEPGVVDEVAAALRRAERPLVATGLTFTRSRARDALLAFVDRQRLPFVTTLHAKGFLPESHPGCLGVMGRARRTDVQRMIDRADLILAVGFDPVEIDYEDWAGGTPVVHVSTEQAETYEGFTPVVNYGGDMDGAIRALAKLGPIEHAWDPAAWAAHREALDKALRPPSQRLAAHHALDVLRAALPPDAILAYDVGAHTHQIATQWRTDLPHTALSTNGWSSMGYGMPAAYAAKLVHADRQVVGVVGDGCFQMTAGELATARRLGLRVPIVVLNDGWLGLMKVKQERLDFPRYGSPLGEPVDAPAHYFGVPVRTARDERSLAAALDWALALDGPSVIEAFIDVEPYSQTVFDM